MARRVARHPHVSSACLAEAVSLVAVAAVFQGEESEERRGLVPGVALPAAWVIGLGSWARSGVAVLAFQRCPGPPAAPTAPKRPRRVSRATPNPQAASLSTTSLKGVPPPGRREGDRWVTTGGAEASSRLSLQAAR